MPNVYLYHLFVSTPVHKSYLNSNVSNGLPSHGEQDWEIVVISMMCFAAVDLILRSMNEQGGVGGGVVALQVSGVRYFIQWCTSNQRLHLSKKWFLLLSPALDP